MTRDTKAQIDDVVLEVATGWRLRTDDVAVIVDKYGVELTRAAYHQVQDEITGGYAIQKPIGYMISLLKKGVIVPEAEPDTKAQGHADFLYERYHRGRWLSQLEGAAGPGSCFCCPGGGPYAGKASPRRSV